jgi:type I restriction enzyme S subunit
MDTKKLRQKILDLAIRGKLVPQDPNDEPASVLLERIRAEKERLIKEGKIKRSKQTASDDEIEAPFEIPESWEWTTVGDICNTCLGKMLDKQKNQGTNQYYLRNINVRWGAFDLSDLLQMPFEEDEEERYSICKGDLVVCEGGEPGRCAIWDSKEAIKFQKALHRVRCNNGVNNRYIRYTLELYAVNGFLEKFYTGSTIKHLTGETLNSLPIPLPPLAEQKRIVDETEHWFAVIDALESNEGDLLKAIDQAKSKILDLAIHGKLVPQDPNDEPAIELLKRINPKFEPCDVVDCPYAVPYSWTVKSFQSVCDTISSKPYQILQSEIKNTGKIPVISQSANYIEGYSDREDCLFNNDNAVLIFGDHTRILKFVDFNFIVGADGVKIIRTSLFTRYVYYVLLFVIQNMQDKGYARHFSLLSKSQIPIPPYNEQLRIVAKIEELFSVLDSIKESLK